MSSFAMSSTAIVLTILVTIVLVLVLILLLVAIRRWRGDSPASADQRGAHHQPARGGHLAGVRSQQRALATSDADVPVRAWRGPPT